MKGHGSAYGFDFISKIGAEIEAAAKVIPAKQQNVSPTNTCEGQALYFMMAKADPKKFKSKNDGYA